jgi:hypothetical protein
MAAAARRLYCPAACEVGVISHHPTASGRKREKLCVQIAMERYLDHHRAIVVSNVGFQATGSEDGSHSLTRGRAGMALAANRAPERTSRSN